MYNVKFFLKNLKNKIKKFIVTPFFIFFFYFLFSFSCKAEVYWGKDGFNWKKINPLPERIGPYYATAFDPQNKRVYVIGGYSSNVNHVGSKSVYLGKIQPDNNIIWTKLKDYPKNVLGTFCFTNEGKLYCLGGDDGKSVLSESYAATINADGTIGDWQSYTSLPCPLHFHGGLFYKNKVLIFGGRKKLYYPDDVNDNSRREIYRLDGTNWTQISQLPIAMDAMAIAVYKGKIYIGGGQITQQDGQSSRCHIDKVYFTTISDNGDLGNWVETSFYPNVINYYLDQNCKNWSSKGIKAYHYMAAYNGYLYVFPAASFAVKGPCKLKQSEWLTSTLRSFRAKINTDGSLNDWEIIGPTDCIFDHQNWELNKMATNLYGGFLDQSKFYLIGGMNYAGVTNAAYYINLLKGDFNDDSQITAADIKNLFSSYAQNKSEFELNSDTKINAVDFGTIKLNYTIQ
ncbi:MAG: hypothetical protein NC935_07120 [Candidatus Omnitrophica bacterium]|nr:hypothetical protein [Candidatus Omnitrophota bacterium]